MSGVTLAQIKAHEAEGDRIESALDKLAREIAEFRGDPVPPDRDRWSYVQGRYSFDRYSIYDGMIDVTFYWSHQGGGDYHRVVFPVAYLTDDWQPFEQAAIDRRNAEIDLEQERRARALV